MQVSSWFQALQATTRGPLTRQCQTQSQLATTTPLHPPWSPSQVVTSTSMRPQRKANRVATATSMRPLFKPLTYPVELEFIHRIKMTRTLPMDLELSHTVQMTHKTPVKM